MQKQFNNASKQEQNRQERQERYSKPSNRPYKKPQKVEEGDVVIFENKRLNVVQIKGKALLVQEQVFPFDDFLVDSESVLKVG